jgi:L-ascorbate metabolism protein UlaG (beta-lactamase superfamily)/pimeloyl-ACP methyl ester carboxylesterase
MHSDRAAGPWTVIVLVAASCCCGRAKPTAPNIIRAKGGDITVTPIMHGSVQIEHAGKVIQVDPAMGDMAKSKAADLILVTDIHDDHLKPGRIRTLRKPGAPVVVPAAVLAQAGKQIAAPVETIANGDKRTIAGVAVEAVAMYNLKNESAPGQPFHTKGRGNGYVITLGGKRLFFAGDTECVPEIRALKDIDVAFLPMNLPYTMSPADAAECAKAFHPKIVYPYHYMGQKPAEFAAAVKDSGVETRLLDWYPPVPREEVIAVARPGSLVDVGGRKIHIYCTGSGSPTVVIESGGMSFAIDWTLVQPEVAKTTRVCSYDRAGSGWSDPAGHAETAEGTVADLHAALSAAGEKPPYVLVAHSIGGLYVRAYQLEHPRDIAGMVLVESAHEDSWKIPVDGKSVPLWAATTDQVRAAAPKMRPPDDAAQPPLPPPSVDQPYDKLPTDVLKTRVTFETHALKALMASSLAQTTEMMESMRRTFVRLHAASANGAHPLGRRPLIVLTAESGPDPEFTALEAKLPQLSTNATQRVVAGSGHEIHLYEPSAVVQGIADVVNAARRGVNVARSATARVP